MFVVSRDYKQINNSHRLIGLFYLLPFALYTVCAFLQTTMFKTIIPAQTFRFLRLLSLAAILLKIFFFNKHTLKQWMLLFLLGLAGVFVWKCSSYPDVLDIIILIVGARNVSFKKIVKVYFVTSLTLLVITIISAKLGFIPNLVYYIGKRRESFGIIYPTNFAAHIFFLILSYIYIRPKRKSLAINILEYAVYAALAVFVYIFCYARTNAILIALTILVSIILYFKRRKRINRVLQIILTYSVSAFAILMIGLTAAYNKSCQFLVKLDTILDNRLNQGKAGLEKYGVSVFGKHIQLNGFGDLKGFNRQYDYYFYLDSSYVRIMLLYGVITIMIICLAYTLFCKKRIQHGDILLPCIIALIALESVMEQHLLEFAYNPFIIVFMAKYGGKTKSLGFTIFEELRIIIKRMFRRPKLPKKRDSINAVVKV